MPHPDIPGDRDRVSALLKQFATECDASGVIFVAEAWTLVTPPDIAERGPEASRAYLAAQARGDWSSHPDRKEIVQVHLEHHRIGARLWIADITRDARGGATLGDWTLSKGDMRGRFADF